jgi:acyl-coenzyme A thioesterase PaaI-like protein
MSPPGGRLGDDVEYPPPHHLLRDLRLTVEHGEQGTSRAHMPVADALRTDLGTVRLGVLATFVDVIGGGLAALAAAPDWIATSDLSVHLGRLSEADDVHAIARVLRRGASTVVLEVDLAEHAGGEPFGIGTLSFSVLPRRADNPSIERIVSGRMEITQSAGFDAHLLDTMGLAVIDAAAGVVRAPVDPYVQNSFGAMQGGMVALVCEVAAEQAMRAATDEPITPFDLQMTYLEQGRVGPLETSVIVADSAPDRWNARVEARDAGDDGKRTTLARVSGGHHR